MYVKVHAGHAIQDSGHRQPALLRKQDKGQYSSEKRQSIEELLKSYYRLPRLYERQALRLDPSYLNLIII